MYLRFAIAAAALLFGSVAAHADTISAFTLNVTFADTVYIIGADGHVILTPVPAPGTLAITGTYMIDTTSGLFVSGDVFVNNNGTVTELTQTAETNAQGANDPAEIDLYVSNQIVSLFGIAVPGSLQGYMGGSLCSLSDLSGSCSNQYGGQYTSLFETAYGDPQFVRVVQSGSLTPTVGAAPEPTSIALLGTGLFGVAGLLRKRLTRT